MGTFLHICSLLLITQLHRCQSMRSGLVRSRRHSENTGGAPHISVSSNVVKPGITYKFTAECSVDADDIHGDDSIVSLLMSFRKEKNSAFNVLGVISSADCHKPIQGEKFMGSIEGNLDEKKGGFLKIEFIYPDANTVGDYRCQMSKKDKFLLFSATASPEVKVTIGSFSLMDVAAAIVGLRSTIAGIENNITEINQVIKSKSWITIQRRMIGDVDFYRTWAEYKKGFGNPETDFWLGLNQIHELTKNGSELKVILNFKGKTAFAHYRDFRVGDEASGYKLTVGGYDTASTAGDSFRGKHNGMKFSTKDADNDIYSASCAQEHHGGFWFSNCDDVQLNGKWGHKGFGSVQWLAFTGEESATYTEMQIKK